jgi:Ni,Fe-hydrogenase I large subunit
MATPSTSTSATPTPTTTSATPTLISAVSGDVVVDPLTRIEGHLRVECKVEAGVVTDAWVTGTLFRGMEIVLKGRAPSDAYYVAQRICGVCPISHGHASTMGTEAATGITIPNGARIVRNIIEGAQYLHSHILWFYTLAALDYIDPVKALDANIADTYALAQAAGTSTADFAGVQKKLKTLVEGGQLSIFTNGPIGAEAYAKDMPAELVLIAVAHYLEALEMQAEAARIIAIMGGKFPHFMTSLPGGTAFVPTDQKLDDILYRAQRVRDWVMNTMIPDTLAIAPYYIDATKYGGGHGNFLAWGVFNRESLAAKDRYLPEGAVFDAQLKLETPAADQVTEFVKHSWYTEESDKLNPASGVTTPDFTKFDTADQYSWAKAPRLKAPSGDMKPMEVGPLARMLVAYLSGAKEVVGIIDATLAKLGAAGKPEVLVSLLGRVAARNLETAVIADWELQWILELVGAIKGGDISYFADPTADSGEGAGLWEAPRGAVGHWINVQNGRIDNYQVVTPSTWNISPRDDKDIRGPMEQALIGTPVAQIETAIEVGRVVRSFDP